ncbi:MAG: Succinyl-CoA ligase [ADP-forming] subunit beta [Alphaproteobacteria bacterium MarineAlpha9_Bin4]|nr:ADP-forming succinate--CoA ligase subunit beta [Pelagibacterales bacterium]PPR27047.1 MAG: Succinyl-CoA ligase [ADP-forming] subunit beta [Alphaproteobacteria bacterium MarineAlpha9_Bin4]|tara:strand:- start:1486 stop:2652 length:1167 start_codon:yes stop_codon:yes gene_type:complete
MNIHEYQAKSLFKSYGLSILDGGVAFTPEDAYEVAKKIDSKKWVIKAQVHAGGRGKGGGIKIANSLSEVKEIATSILGMNLVTPQTGAKGKKVLKVYVEKACEIKKEFYLGIVLDRSKGKFVIMASTEGGMDIEKVAEEKPEKIFKVTLDPSDGIKQFQIRQLAFNLLIPNTAFKSFNKQVNLLANIAKEKDFTLVEINPLILTNDDKIIALDAKVNIDDNALFRNQDLKELLDESEVDPKELEAEKYDLSYVKLDGKIGCMVNGAGLAMATMDIIKLKGSSPANFLDVGGGASKDKVKGAFKIIISDRDVEAILVNIFGGIMRCDIIAEGIVEAVKEINLDKPLVVRLEGTNVEEGKKILQESNLDIIAASNLEEAAEKIVSVVEGK